MVKSASSLPLIAIFNVISSGPKVKKRSTCATPWLMLIEKCPVFISMGIPAVKAAVVRSECSHGVGAHPMHGGDRVAEVGRLHSPSGKYPASAWAIHRSSQKCRASVAHSSSVMDHLSGGLFEPLRREAQSESSHRLGGSVAAAQPNL